MLGDVLIEVAEQVPGGGTLHLGHGYLVPEYPETQEVLQTRRPRALSLADADIDEGEALILREMGFDALLMVPLEVRGEIWGLVEVYRTGTPFSDDDVRRAAEVVAELGTTLEVALDAPATG
jgi:GAF domain-containing protein